MVDAGVPKAPVKAPEGLAELTGTLLARRCLDLLGMAHARRGRTNLEASRSGRREPVARPQQESAIAARRIDDVERFARREALDR